MNLIKWLEGWYKSNCDGYWEHSYGVTIETLDNPGWKIDINLIDTELEDKVFETIQIKRTEHDWIYCEIKNNVFKGGGGPENLEEILIIFKEWASN